MLGLCFIERSTSFPFVYLCYLFEFSSFALTIFFWLVKLLYTQNIFSFFPVSSTASGHPSLCALLLHSVYWYLCYCVPGPMFSELIPCVFVSWYAVLIYLAKIILLQGQHCLYYKIYNIDSNTNSTITLIAWMTWMRECNTISIVLSRIFAVPAYHMSMLLQKFMLKTREVFLIHPFPQLLKLE